MSKRRTEESLNFKRFVGVSMGGGKTDKTSIAVIDYFADHQKVFLSQLIEKVGASKSTRNKVSADQRLVEEIKDLGQIELLGVDVPSTLPKCITCKLKCPGFEKCSVKEIKWMRDYYQKRQKKRPNLPPTPYTERAVELFLLNGLEEPFSMSHALGANAAPLTARMHFLQKQLNFSSIEVRPKISVWRIGRMLKMGKTQLRYHRHSVDGEKVRETFLSNLGEKKMVFIYQQDLRSLAADGIAFDAFITALTAFLKFRGKCQARPTGFPRTAAWIEFPTKQVSW